VGVGVKVGVWLGTGVAVGLGVKVGVWLGTGVAVGLGVLVGVMVGLGMCVAVRLGVGVGDPLESASAFCGTASRSGSGLVRLN
jgi:hypothetical protein